MAESGLMAPRVGEGNPWVGENGMADSGRQAPREPFRVRIRVRVRVRVRLRVTSRYLLPLENDAPETTEWRILDAKHPESLIRYILKVRARVRVRVRMRVSNSAF